MAETASSRAGGGRRELVFAGVASLVAVTLVAVLVLFLGARLDAPTLGLAVTCTALLYALRGLFSVVTSLARPDVELVLQDVGARGRAQGELRDEKRRLLRAIKELDFDFGVGKLSKADYEDIRGAYQVRAIDAMRELEGASSLHPDLEAVLARVDDAVEAVAPIPGCPACQGTNDVDAKFCKHCGAALKGQP